MTSLNVDGIDFLCLSILVLWTGRIINHRVSFLERNSIPNAVTGGILFSIAVACLESYKHIDVTFDMQLRNLLLLVFFSTIGLTASFHRLAAGGKPLALLVLLAGGILVVQDVAGVSIAKLLGHHPGYGLMAGSVSFAGGHGTAIAWGAEAAKAGLLQAQTVGIAFATFGLISGGLVGGPLGRYLIERNKLSCTNQDDTLHQAPKRAQVVPLADDTLFHSQRTLLYLALCVALGDLVNRYLFANHVLLPGFLTAMLVGIVLTNGLDLLSRPLSREPIEQAGNVSLGIFLAMSLMSMDLLPLFKIGPVLLLVLVVQTVLTLAYCLFVIFPLMGRNYDAAVICSGFAGLGMGATPVAIANMDAVTQHYGPSAKAFLIVPLVGAFFIDLMNAIVIKFFIGALAYLP
ncbi:sodium/glutamate symporter [Aestuariicella hydrocarbonica]|uniref:Sodium/glutamate symporter n=1 Tax=Pseudomaricurvus hydrocarbonicus TaxID=1470433 RepID=A0A9E5MPI8_9GAMM|nr:sodium/glutamate symporter [Aestuariicella hydrocarbonica]